MRDARYSVLVGAKRNRRPETGGRRPGGEKGARRKGDIADHCSVGAKRESRKAVCLKRIAGVRKEEKGAGRRQQMPKRGFDQRGLALFIRII